MNSSKSELDRNALRIKALKRYDILDTPRDGAFDRLTRLDCQFLNVPIDPRTLANPFVAGQFGLKFYASFLLKTCDGYNLGTFCIIDKQLIELHCARIWADKQNNMIKGATLLIELPSL